MDHYTMERWILERHQEVVRRAEGRARLNLTVGNPKAARWAAERLRQVADLLDGGASVEAPSFSATGSP